MFDVLCLLSQYLTMWDKEKNISISYDFSFNQTLLTAQPFLHL